MKGYRPVSVSKRGGGKREVYAPLPRLARAQSSILSLLSHYQLSLPYAHGFIRGRSIITNATPHCGKRFVINLDLRSFFHTITEKRARGAILALTGDAELAREAAKLCTAKPVPQRGRHLLQGQCTSPLLANLCAARLDRRIASAASQYGYTFTRYADDLTLSGDGPFSTMLALVRHIIADEGFTLNERKTRVMPSTSLQLVTGLCVNGAVPTLPPKVRARYLRILRVVPPRVRQGIQGHMQAVARLQESAKKGKE